MIFELERIDYPKARVLYRELEFHLTSFAVLDGMNPGRVFVEDPAAPKSSFMISPEGSYLAGTPDNEKFNSALNEALFSGALFDRKDTWLYFILSSDGWIDQLGSICAPRSPLAVARRHYVCRHLVLDWRNRIPDGFTVRPIDGTLLSETSLEIPEHILEWIQNNWGSTADFLQRGFGAVTLHGNKIVSWSVADCRSGDGCEIGIQTDPEYRQRGLAAITAAAAVETAFSSGFSMVGWQCNEDNAGSFRTAERVGFELERCYTMYYMCLDETRHQAEMDYIAAKRAAR
jgi:RimJ/RimL family protein N-acetyltransferase